MLGRAAGDDRRGLDDDRHLAERQVDTTKGK